MKCGPSLRPHAFVRVSLALLMICGLARARADELPGEPATEAPQARCAVAGKSPTLLAVRAIQLPRAAWVTTTPIKVDLRFTVDATGHPADVVAEASGVDDAQRSAFEQTIDATFESFRFCAPVLFATDAKWRASLLFSPMGKRGDAEDRRFFMQMFVPSYVGFERFGHHAGRVVVRGFYGSDGRARSVAIAEGSGDKVLDDKSLDAMATAQLVFPDGRAPWTDPMVVVRPFVYRP